MKINVTFDEAKLKEAHLDSPDDLLCLARSLGLKDFNESLLLRFKVASATISPADLARVESCNQVSSIETDQQQHAL